ncbi:hypothetical protein [Solibacillus sp. FSL K6-1523]|uniref:hypothetical protein n=1 Tax=Solibacillus sp. FSL K6-1523 TaxID=2921471 RepID=UPI0030F7EA86
MDTLIIEHLACMEVNRIILQEPYRLVSEVQFNDKSPCFDGEIIVYNSSELKKQNIEDTVKVQIKGTTKNKKVKGNKTSHPIEKADLEIYKKTGKGVLYLLVVIEKKTTKMQAFYKALTPLEIERLLNIIIEKGQSSLSVDFKIIEDGQLEQICKTQISRVRKQPSSFIDVGKSKDFSTYRLEYDILSNEFKNFNPLETPVHIYGIENGKEFPIEAAIPDALNISMNETFELLEEKIDIKFNIIDSREELHILIEDTLEFVFSKKNKKGKLNIIRMKSLDSYIKSLKTLKYISLNNKFPFKIYHISSFFDDKKQFINIDEEINKYEKLMKVCKRIGISERYEFDERENFDFLFDSIYNIFEEKNYARFTAKQGFEEHTILRIELSDYITLILIKDTDDLFYSIFNRRTFKKIGAFIPKTKEMFNPNTDAHYKVSLFSGYQLKDLITLTNFDFEVYNESFRSDSHDKSLTSNNEISLGIVAAFDESEDVKFLDLAKYLLDELISATEDNEIYKLNLLQIKKRLSESITEEEEEFLYSIIDGDNQPMRFVAYVILGLKIPAQKIFSCLNDEQKQGIVSFPIYTLYSNL